MSRFSARSRRELASCDPRIQLVFEEVGRIFECTILKGQRPKEEQDEKYAQGLSRVKWPGSKHNCVPSKAVDAAPYPIDWNDRERFTYFAGIVVGIAAARGVKLRWGGDWDRDTKLTDNAFDDLPHFEIVE